MAAVILFREVPGLHATERSLELAPSLFEGKSQSRLLGFEGGIGVKSRGMKRLSAMILHLVHLSLLSQD